MYVFNEKNQKIIKNHWKCSLKKQNFYQIQIIERKPSNSNTHIKYYNNFEKMNNDFNETRWIRNNWTAWKVINMENSRKNDYIFWKKMENSHTWLGFIVLYMFQ